MKRQRTLENNRERFEVQIIFSGVVRAPYSIIFPYMCPKKDSVYSHQNKNCYAALCRRLVIMAINTNAREAPL